jgi:hypothetical protein
MALSNESKLTGVFESLESQFKNQPPHPNPTSSEDDLPTLA